MIISPSPCLLPDDRATPNVPPPVPWPPVQGALGRVVPDFEKNLRRIAAEGHSSSDLTAASPESPRSEKSGGRAQM